MYSIFERTDQRAASMASRRDLIIIYTHVFISLILLIDKSLIVLCTDSSTVKKCCSPGSVLTQKDEAYICEPFASAAASEENGVEFFQRISGSWGYPACQNGGSLRTISFADFNANDRYIRSDYCADIFYNHHENQNFNDTGVPVVLLCDNSNHKFGQRDFPTLLKMRRCCNNGEIFKFKNRACLPPEFPQENISTASLFRNIGTSDFIHAIRGPPKCQHAIVDYEVNATDVSIVGGRLQVAASSTYDVVNLLATEESACLDVGSSPGLLVVRVCRGIEFCRNHACLRKCCAEDEALVTNVCRKLPSHLTLAKWHSEVWELPKIMKNTTNKIMNTTEYGLLVGEPCLYQMYPISREEGWHIVTEGMIHVSGYKTYEHHQYCTDMFYNHSLFSDGFYPFICFEDPPPEDNSIKTRYRVNAALLIISCALLLLTLLVYICLPTLQNLHGKTLMCHVASLLTAFGCLAIVAVATPKEEYIDANSDATILSSAILCRFLGYTMLFAFLSAFFWLNVMCFDIWWKFGSLRHSGKTNTKRRDDLKRFLSYCCYAWGLALAFVIVAIIADEVDFLPSNFKPDMGFNRCWFSTEQAVYGEVLFFTGPVSIQLLVNLIFFILTARRCSMVKADIQRRIMVNRSDSRSRRFESDKSKLILNVKLFVVMGISWVLEIVSYFLSNYVSTIQWKEEFFYVSDVVNCLQGLLIFVLFVLKKKVFHALKRKFCKSKNRRASTGGILDPYRVRKSPSSSTILSTFAVSSSP